MGPAKISIVTPSYNQLQFLPATMKSVLSQGYSNLEYILVDGGSTDGSAKVIEQHAEQLHFHCSEADGGHAQALNKGFAQSSGEIMAWLNSDDMYLPWTFAVVEEIFRLFPHVHWIQGHANYWSDTGFLIPLKRSLKNGYDFLQGDYGWIQQESTFWRRSLWERAGGSVSEDYKLMVDGELWSRFFQHERLYNVDCALGGYRLHGSNRAQLNNELCHKEMQQIITTMRDTLPADKRQEYERLKFFNPITARKFARKHRINRLLARSFPTQFSAVSYPLLSYEDGQWHESELSYGHR